MNKRGVIELHFNWIFVLIAGAIIFVFFISIVNKQREFSEIKASGIIITNLESILTGAQVSTGTVNVIDMPKIDMSFECDRYFIGFVRKPTLGNVIFAPSLLKGKELITWALDWNLPFRVTNFLYLTDPELRYVIVYDDSTEIIASIIDEELPKEINKEKIKYANWRTFEDKNNYKVKFIFLKNVDTNFLGKLNKMPDEDVTAIELNLPADSNVIPSTGTIEFYQKSSISWQLKGETYYLKEESLFGAIFAEDIDMYNCVMKKAFKKLNLVTKIYLDRCNELSSYYSINDITCAAPHSSAITQLNYMETISNQNAENFPEGAIDSIKRINDDYSKGIKYQNQRAQLFSCALIY